MGPLAIKPLAALHSVAGACDFEQLPIQAGMPGPWHVAVCSMIHERTGVKTARELVTRVLTRWPNPQCMSFANYDQLLNALDDCTNCERKARSLIAFSADWLRGNWLDARDLPGVTTYIADCIGVFCLSDYRIESSDLVLKGYILCATLSQQSQSGIPSGLTK